ncbi:MAG: caspase family protein [Methyloligellaceae bacterium]
MTVRRIPSARHIRWCGLTALAAALTLVLGLTNAQAQTRDGRTSTAYRVIGVEARDVLNVRSAPGTEAAIVGALPPNAADIVKTGRNARLGSQIWTEIRYGNVKGWVNARFLGAQQIRPAKRVRGRFRVINVALGDVLNMRAGASTTHPIVSRIPPQARGITALGAKAQVGRSIWWQIDYGGAVGWVNSRFLAPDAGTTTPPARVTVAPSKKNGPDSGPVVPAPAEIEGQRVALVIGNGAYSAQSRIPRLANPPNDGRDMARALRGLGFKVIEAIDADLDGMQSAVDRFGREAVGAWIALVFYAGHGIQANGENYLLPVSISLDKHEDLLEQSFSLSEVMRALTAAKPSLSLVILDACRNNPVTTKLATNAKARGLARIRIGKGLARHKGAPGTLIAYSTDPNNVADDGSGRNSPFTKALLKHMQEPELEIRLMFGNVREAVSKETKAKQTPWVEEAVLGRFYFKPPPKIRTTRFHGTWSAEHYTLKIDADSVRLLRPPYVGEAPRVFAQGSKECTGLFKKEYAVVPPGEIHARLTDPQIHKWAKGAAAGKSLLMMKMVCGFRTHIFYVLLADYQRLLFAEFSEQDYLIREEFYRPPN